MIHTTGEPSIASQIKISPNFVSVTTAALRRKCTIITDAEMVKAGINKRNLTICGNDVVCAIHDPEVIKLAQKVGTTRAVAAVSYLAPEIEQSIFAVGNAPTALYEVLRLIVEGDLRPAAIIGVPVGFVGAAESKELLISLALNCGNGDCLIALQGTREEVPSPPLSLMLFLFKSLGGKNV